VVRRSKAEEESRFRCKHCSVGIVNILTVDGMGWFHYGIRPGVIYESCYMDPADSFQEETTTVAEPSEG